VESGYKIHDWQQILKNSMISMANIFKKVLDISIETSYIGIMEKKMKQVSVYAKSLGDRKYHQRVVLAKKGRGSYNRKKLEIHNA